MSKIIEWTAKRSGASLTVRGKLENGAPTTITHVHHITSGKSGTFAVRGADRFQLA